MWTSIVRGSRKSDASPERLEERGAGVDPARMRGQRAQELELDVGQLHRFAPGVDRPAGEVDHGARRLSIVSARGSGGASCARRSSARTRLRNSRIENGFVM